MGESCGDGVEVDGLGGGRVDFSLTKFGNFQFGHKGDPPESRLRLHFAFDRDGEARPENNREYFFLYGQCSGNRGEFSCTHLSSNDQLFFVNTSRPSQCSTAHRTTTMDQVIQNLWLGSIVSIADVDSLNKNNIRSVLSAMRGKVVVQAVCVSREDAQNPKP